MLLRFTKMHGLGNDFAVFDAINQPIDFTPDQCRFIADRHLGIGCDQILLVEPARSPDTDFYYRIFNADGNEVEQCGNGVRCFARFVHNQGLCDKAEIHVGTQAGVVHLYNQPDGTVKVNMGRPVLDPAAIPLQAEHQQPSYLIQVGEEALEFGAVSMGNPHAVLQVEQIDTAPVQQIGQLLQQHPHFPQRVNAGFMQRLSREAIRLRVFERGVGETRACGTGACAAVVAGRLQGLLAPQVKVHLPGGDLVIEWQGEGHPVWMSGPVATVFEGKIEL
jgi:diaminopimelate epimerase